MNHVRRIGCAQFARKCLPTFGFGDKEVEAHLALHRCDRELGRIDEAHIALK